jgi:CBS domain containing-hemolysin-like protein
MVRLGVREGQIDEWESHIVRNLLRLPKLRVKEILTPRTVVFALPESMTIDQVFEENPEIPFSRIPIFESNHDDINGFVLKSDILLAQARDQHEARLYSLKREIRSIPETASLSNLFEFLLEKREHIPYCVFTAHRSFVDDERGLPRRSSGDGRSGDDAISA